MTKPWSDTNSSGPMTNDEQRRICTEKLWAGYVITRERSWTGLSP